MLDLERQDWGNFASNIEFLERTGLLQSPKRILEIGCGEGRLLQALHEAGHQISAIDSERDTLDQCPPGLDVQVADGAKLPFDENCFDLVLSFDVLEHIPDTDRHLEEVRRVLKPNGHYLLQTPNKWANIPFEMVRWSTLYGIKRTFDFLKPPQHCALHSYYQLRRRFLKHQFDIEFFDIGVVNAYFIGKVKMHLGRPGVFMLKIINPDRLPIPLRTNFYVRAQLH